jgi:hypothetical protein
VIANPPKRSANVERKPSLISQKNPSAGENAIRLGLSGKGCQSERLAKSPKSREPAEDSPIRQRLRLPGVGRCDDEEDGFLSDA